MSTDGGHGSVPGARWLAGICALALLLRGWHATSQNLWIDEVLTARIVATPVADLVHPTAATPIQPTAWLSPLFFAVLKAAVAVSPAPFDATLRWYAVLAGTAGVAAIAAAIAGLLGRTAGITGGLIAALSPFDVWYSQEVRPYALLLLTTTVAVAALHRGLERGSRAAWWTFVVATALAWYTHPIALVVPAVAVADGVLERVWRDADRRWWLGTALAAIGLAAVPALAGVAVKGANAIADPRGAGPLDLLYALYTFAVGFSLGPSTTALHELGLDAVRASWPLVALTALLFGAVAAVGWFAVGGRVRTRLLVWLAVPLVVPLTMALLSGNPLNVRYVMVAFPAFLALLAAGITSLWTRARPIAVPAVVLGGVLCACSIWNLHHDERYVKEDCRAAARLLDAEAAPEDVIVVNASYMQDAVAYYFHGSAPIVGVPHHDAPVDAAELRRQLDAAIGDRRRVWLVRSRTFHGDRAGLIPRMLAERRRAAGGWAFPGVRVDRYVLPDATARRVEARPAQQVRGGRAIDIASAR